VIFYGSIAHGVPVKAGGHVYISEGAVVTGFKAAKSSTVLGKRI